MDGAFDITIVEADPKAMVITSFRKKVAVKALAIGGRVAHDEYGKGIVVSCDGRGVEVKFDSGITCEFTLPAAVRSHEIEALDQKRTRLPEASMVKW